MSEAIDPRAVRATVAPTGRVDGDPVVVVGPLPEPVLRPLAGLAGTAILGGIASPPPAGTTPTDGTGAAPATGAPADAAPMAGTGAETAAARARPKAPAPGASATDTDGPALLVDGQPVAVGLERLDLVHAVLVEAAAVAPGPPGSGSPAPAVGSPATAPADRTRVLLGEVRRRTADGATLREVVVDGWRFEVEIESERRANLRERARRGHEVAGRSGPVEVHAIIPGRIVALSVTAGDEVVAGQQVLVLEAMKMQNELRAPREGKVERIPIAVGDNVEVGDLLMVIT